MSQNRVQISFELILEENTPVIEVHISGPSLGTDQVVEVTKAIRESFTGASPSILDTETQHLAFSMPKNPDPQTISGQMESLITSITKNYAVSIDMGALDNAIDEKVQEMQDIALQEFPGIFGWGDETQLMKTIRALSGTIHNFPYSHSSTSGNLQLINNYAPIFGNKLGIMFGSAGLAILVILLIAGAIPSSITITIPIAAKIVAAGITAIGYISTLYSATTRWLSNRALDKTALSGAIRQLSDEAYKKVVMNILPPKIAAPSPQFRAQTPIATAPPVQTEQAQTGKGQAPTPTTQQTSKTS